MSWGSAQQADRLNLVWAASAAIHQLGEKRTLPSDEAARLDLCRRPYMVDTSES